MTRPKNDSTQQMKVYLVLDISRGAQPVLGCWTCAVDAVPKKWLDGPVGIPTHRSEKTNFAVKCRKL
jgi:hypothetical protein